MKPTVLVLDDESLILASLEHLFEDDYQVHTTTDAVTALRLVVEHDIAVILCDERMPGLSGHEFLRRVKEVSKATRLMISGYADLSALTQAVNSGQIFAYVSKPWDPITLKATVGAAVVQFRLVHEIDHERELLRALMENSPDLIYFKDRQFRFTRVNQAHALALGAGDSAECVGRTDSDYFESEDALRWRMQEEKIVRSGEPQIDRIEQVKGFQGNPCWMSTTKVPMFDLVGRVSGIAGISRDITALKNSEIMLREEKASAELANRAKSEFLTTMSHEMRTPMNAILGMADVLCESPLNQEQRDYVRIFQKAGANLLDLINNVLDLSKVESGRFELESIGFHLGAVLDKSIEMMAPRARDRGLELSLEILPGVAMELVGDPNRLGQILVNLIGNAVKFTAQGSVTVRVEPERVERDRAGAGSWLRFSVADTGIGIAADKTEMIFENFTQADSSTTRRYGGTGLGLAISKGLVERMGGRIACTSEAGKGSTFFFTAPFEIGKETEIVKAAEPAAAVFPPAESAGPHPVTRILIAEDSEDNLFLTKAYLKDCGFALDIAENGRIAVEKAISGSAQLVLMDVQMPVMDGLQATHAIREWEAETGAPPMPILALTAHATAEAVARSLAAGCTEHLTKPIKKATLLEAISRHIAGTIRITPPEGVESRVPKYVANIRRDMEAILADADSKDCSTALRLGHQFKGTGEGYGFPEIARAGAAVELAAMNVNHEEIRTQIRALAAYLDRVEVVVT
jgi:PAS domain S-box-containing protein